MPNILPTPVIIADKMLEYLFEGSGVIDNVNRDYESEFAMTKDAIGKVVMVKNPPRFQSQKGPVISNVQSTNFGLTPFKVDNWSTVPFKLTGEERTFQNAKELDLWADKNIKPVVSPMLADIEVAIFGLATKIPNFVGTPGTGPTTIDALGAAKEKLSLHQTPQEDRVCFFDPTGTRRFVSGSVVFSNTGGAFNPQDQLGKQFVDGSVMSKVAGFDMREANFIYKHTVGSATSTGSNILTNGLTPQVGKSIAIDTWTTGTTIKAGDVITIAGVYAVNPVTKKSTGQLRQFVVDADVTAAGNAGTISVTPSVIPSGAFQNVTGATADITGVPDGAIVTIVTGTASTQYGQQLAWWKKAIGLVTVPIAPLEGVVKSVQRTYQGINITFSMGGDIMNFETIYRLDMAFGVNAFDPYLDQVVRITN